MRQGLWFALGDLYSRYYAVTRGGVSAANAEAGVDEEGEAREGGNVGEDKELIGRGGDDTVDTAGGRGGGGGRGARRGDRKGAHRGPGGKPGRSRGGKIDAGGWRQGEALCLL